MIYFAYYSGYHGISGAYIIVATINWLLHVVHFNETLLVLMFVELLVLVLLVIGLIAARQASSSATQRLTAARHNEVQLIRS